MELKGFPLRGVELHVEVLLAERVRRVTPPDFVPVHHEHDVILLLAEGPVVFGMLPALFNFLAGFLESAKDRAENVEEGEGRVAR